MTQVETQDTDTKYKPLNITGFRVKKNALFIGKNLSAERELEKHLTCIKRANWVRREQG